MLMAVATGGCAELLGIEEQPALSVYDAASRPSAVVAATPTPRPQEARAAEPQEARAPVVSVVRVPGCCANALVTVTCEEAIDGPRASREKAEPPPPAPYKPSPYVAPRPPPLYHND